MIDLLLQLLDSGLLLGVLFLLEVDFLSQFLVLILILLKLLFQVFYSAPTLFDLVAVVVFQMLHLYPDLLYLKQLFSVLALVVEYVILQFICEIFLLLNLVEVLY